MSKKSLWGVIIGVFILGIGVVGYVQNRNENKVIPLQPQTSMKQTVKNNYNTKTDEDITKLMNKEKDVTFANVATHPSIVFAVVALKNKPTVVYAQSLVDKYFPKLVGKYPNVELVMHVTNHETGKLIVSKEIQPKK